MALVLFDIDGTLCRSLGIGRKAFESALAELFGLFQHEERFAFDGLLDTQIARRSLELVGVQPTQEAVDRLLRRYVELLAACEPGPLGDHLCPGIPGCLVAVREAGHHLALLTGNVRAGAAVKLRLFGLERHFRDGGSPSGLLGAFGDDAAERHRLVPVALERCSAFYGRPFEKGETWIVGDSVRDVEAARLGGIRCAAVATGFTEIERLRASSPDLLLEDLSDPLPLLSALGPQAPG
jgi:phosphoglycolate phosphatase-like HAD superfamily hydrolase